MKFKELQKLNKSIARISYQSKKPVINELRSTQKYLLISSDPSADTDKTKAKGIKHSDFEERTVALFFFGSDDSASLAKIRKQYPKYREVFSENIYWTHYSKTYAAGNPTDFWAKRYLFKEIELFEPKLIIIFGNKPADFLLGRGKLIDRVNKIFFWEKIPVICCLHPSKDWNISLRGDYFFKKTWDLIRLKIRLTI